MPRDSSVLPSLEKVKHVISVLTTCAPRHTCMWHMSVTKRDNGVTKVQLQCDKMRQQRVSVPQEGDLSADLVRSPAHLHVAHGIDKV